MSLQDVIDQLKDNGETLDDGNFMTIPASISANFVDEWNMETTDGACTKQKVDDGFTTKFIPPSSFYCMKVPVIPVRAGVGASFSLSESTNRTWGDPYKLTFDIDLISVIPLFNYNYDVAMSIDPPANPEVAQWRKKGPSDQSSFATFTFKWDSDIVTVYDEVQSLTPTAMAAILIGSIAAAFACIDRMSQIYEEMSEEPM